MVPHPFDLGFGYGSTHAHTESDIAWRKLQYTDSFKMPVKNTVMKKKTLSHYFHSRILHLIKDRELQAGLSTILQYRYKRQNPITMVACTKRRLCLEGCVVDTLIHSIGGLK